MTETLLGDQLISSDHDNILVNGSFENWSGTTSIIGTGADNPCGADKWTMGAGNQGANTSVWNVSKETVNVDQGLASLKINLTTLGNNGVYVRQYVDNFADYRGKTITFTIRVKSTVAGLVANLDDGISNFNSNASTGSGNFETLTVTGTMGATASRIACTFSISAVGILYADSAMAVVGAATVNFIPTNLEVEKLKFNGYAGLYQYNILDNAGFEIWQRGTSFTNPASYTTDHWFVTSSCTSHSVAQEGTNIDTGIFSARVIITTAAGGVHRLCQSIENPTQYVGKVMTYSMRVKSNVAGVKLFVSYIGGQTASAVGHTGGNGWETLSLTLTIPASGLTFAVGFDSVNTTVGSSVSPSAGTFYVDSALLVFGSAVTTFIPLHPQQDLARCQRYYWQINSTNTGPVAMMQCTSATSAYGLIFYPVQMRASPTTTLTGQTISELYTATQGGAGTVSLSLSTTIRTAQIVVTVASGLVAGNATSLVPTNNGFIIEFSAD